VRWNGNTFAEQLSSRLSVAHGGIRSPETEVMLFCRLLWNDMKEDSEKGSQMRPLNGDYLGSGEGTREQPCRGAAHTPNEQFMFTQTVPLPPRWCSSSADPQRKS